MTDQRYVRASANLDYGQWMLRLFGWFFALKAPWCVPLFSERCLHGVRVIPLGFGWRITVRPVPKDAA